MSLRVYSADEVHAALPWAELADALEDAFVDADTEVPLRHAHALGGDGTLLLMPAWSAAALGVKLVTVMPGAAAHGAGTVQASYLLLDRATGEPRALLDGEALTLRRTAAASALAAQHLARPDARRLLIVGSGRLAPWMARAHVALNPELVHVAVWGRNADAAEDVVEVLRDEGIDAEVAEDLRAAVQAAEVITCATTSREPLVRGAWLAPGTHLDLVGGFRRDMREADDAALARARIVVDTYAGALAEAGDLVQPLQTGVIAREQVLAELAEVLRGEVRVRLSPDDVTLFKSVGTALEDLAAARLVVGTS
ncbi:MAG TPA: ornithine cyclodeaminase family protein [Burkholderiaceae bacterium]|jgi:alanine dehydrogenase|nr:ornithine cyclodeaminase family protein [Burkholderiaceae bacterium]